MTVASTRVVSKTATRSNNVVKNNKTGCLVKWDTSETSATRRIAVVVNKKQQNLSTWFSVSPCSVLSLLQCALPFRCLRYVRHPREQYRKRCVVCVFTDKTQQDTNKIQQDDFRLLFTTSICQPIQPCEQTSTRTNKLFCCVLIVLCWAEQAHRLRSFYRANKKSHLLTTTRTN